MIMNAHSILYFFSAVPKCQLAIEEMKGNERASFAIVPFRVAETIVGKVGGPRG